VVIVKGDDMYRLIGIAGKARSGKDTVGNHLVEYYNFHRYAFADPIKKACCEMFGITMKDFADDVKEVVNEFWKYSPRQMAQLLGTEGGRILFDEDIWVKRAEVEWNNFISGNNELELNTFGKLPLGMVITDVRFDNEAEWVRSMGGEVWHIEREGTQKVNNHVSEAGVTAYAGDYVIANNGTIEELFAYVDQLLIYRTAARDTV